MPSSGRGGLKNTKKAATRGRKGKKSQSSGLRSVSSAISSSSGNGLSTQISEAWTPLFPSSTVRRLRYSTTFPLTSAAGVVTSYVLRANDMFDPDFSSVGHQPMGFDQMMLVFNHFTVLSSKIIVSAHNSAVNTPTVCVRVDGDSTPLTVVDRILEMGGCVQNTVKYLESVKLALNVDIARLQGVSRSALSADPYLQGSAIASPVECSYFHVQLWNTSAATSTCNFDVIMEFEALFTEPRNDIESLTKEVHRRAAASESKFEIVK
jgi:hypothetical protein